MPGETEIAKAATTVIEAAVLELAIPVERERVEVLQSKELPRVLLWSGERVTEEWFLGGGELLALSFQVEMALDGAGHSGAARVDLITSLRNRVELALVADRTLGGLAVDLEVTTA